MQLLVTIKSCCGDSGWTSACMPFSVSDSYCLFPSCLSFCLCPLKVAKIADLLRVEFTLHSLFAPPHTLSPAPSSLPFALCHQSAAASKNSSIVIITDLPRFSGPPLLSNTGSCFSCLIYFFSLFVLTQFYITRCI